MLKMLDPTTLPTASPGSLRWRPERRPRVRAARVEDVSAGAAGEQCGELAGGQLVRLEHTRRRGTERSHRPTLGKDRLPQRHTQHEVDVELEVAGVPRRSGVGEPPLPARVLGRHPLDRQPIAGAHRAHGLLDLRAFVEHRFPGRRADVVEVDVDRQPRHVEDEEVERRAPLERDARLQERMRVQSVQQGHEAEDLFEGLGGEASRASHASPLAS